MTPTSGKRLPLMKRRTVLAHASFLFLIFNALLLNVSQPLAAQKRAPSGGFEGKWNWAVYAKDKSELPPAYREMELREVPAYALDLTLRRKGNRLHGEYGLLARYLAKVDEGSFTTTITGGSARVNLKSNFGGSATVVLTLRGDKLHWRTIRSTGEAYFPKDAVLRRLRRGERLPYEAEDGRD